MGRDEKKSPMEQIDSELFEAPLADKELEEAAGGLVATYCHNEEATGIGQSEAFDSIRDS